MNRNKQDSTHEKFFQPRRSTGILLRLGLSILDTFESPWDLSSPIRWSMVVPIVAIVTGIFTTTTAVAGIFQDIEAIHGAFDKLKECFCPPPESTNPEGNDADPPSSPLNQTELNRPVENESSDIHPEASTNGFDACIISLHPPSMLHRLSQSSTFIRDIESKLKRPPFKKTNISILLVDGNDEENMKRVVKKDFKNGASFIFVGEGIVLEKDSTVESSGLAVSDICDLLKKLKDENRCCPQVYFALKYGAEAVKIDLEDQGFKDIHVWDLKCQRSKSVIVDVWKDSNLLGKKGLLYKHFYSLEKESEDGTTSVETMVWSPPTEDWRRESNIKNLTLKVGDAEAIEKVKHAITQAVESERTASIEIQPRDSNSDALYNHARAITFYGLQEASKTITEDLDSPLGWYYVSTSEHLSKIAEEMKEQEDSGYVIIWMDGRDLSTLNLKDWSQEVLHVDLKVIYVITKTVGNKDNGIDIVEQIKEMHEDLLGKDIKSIKIDDPKTDIDLSEREVSFDITLEGTLKNEWDKVRTILLKHLFDTTSSSRNAKSAIEPHEVTFYDGDEDRVHGHVGVRNILHLKNIFSSIFFPDNRKSMDRDLKNISTDIKLQYKMKNSLKIFQECVLKLNTPTKNQKRALKEIEKLGGRVRIDGRAGSGKTFIAMCRLVKVLIDGSGLVLLCMDSEALIYEIVKCVCARFGEGMSDLEKNEMLKRVHFYSRQSSSGDNTQLYHIQIESDDEDEDGDEEEKILKKIPITDEEKCEYDFIMVDEGHHVFRKGEGE